MLWPTRRFPGKVLLLSAPDNFNATYIRRTLEICGTSVLIASSLPDPLSGEMPDDDLGEIVGCVAIDLDSRAAEALAARQLPFPLLFVGGYPGIPLPSAYAWMHAPFASYQVIERLMALVLRA